MIYSQKIFDIIIIKICLYVQYIQVINCLYRHIKAFDDLYITSEFVKFLQRNRKVRSIADYLWMNELCVNKLLKMTPIIYSKIIFLPQFFIVLIYKFSGKFQYKISPIIWSIKHLRKNWLIYEKNWKLITWLQWQ